MFKLISSLMVVLATCAPPVPPPEPDLDTLWVVNTQQYRYGDLEPALVAYRAVARHEGWDDLEIEAWLPFVSDVILKESGGCPAVRGGTLYNAVGDDCTTPAVRGTREDTGFGQVTRVLYHGRNTTLCKMAGLCTWQQIAGTPWDSMRALVVTIRHHGSFPWCYDARARGYHDCGLVP